MTPTAPAFADLDAARDLRALGAVPPRGASAAETTVERFRATFERAAEAAGHGVDPKLAREARENAEKLVSEAFVKPLLEMASERTFAAEGPFAPGDVEKRFTPLLNERIADAVVQRAQWDIVDVITDRVLEATSRRAGATATTVPDAAGTAPGRTDLTA